MKRILLLSLVMLLALQSFSKCMCGDTCKYSKDMCLSSVCEKLYNGCDKCIDSNFVVLDFKSGDYYIYQNKNLVKYKKLNQLKLKYHEAYKLKIVNINLYLYAVDFHAEDIVSYSDPSPLLENLFLGSGTGIATFASSYPTKAADAGIIDPTERSKKNTEEMEKDFPKFKNFNEKLKAFTTLYQMHIDRQLRAFDLCDIVNTTCCDSNERNKYNYSTIDQLFRELNEAYSFAKQEQQNVILTGAVVADSIIWLDGLVKECESIRAKLQKKEIEPDEKQELLLQKSELGVCDGKHIALLERLRFREAKIKFSETLSQALDSFWAHAIKPGEQQIQNLALFNRNLLKNNFSFTSGTIFPEGNMLNFELDIKPETTKAGDLTLRYPLKSFYSSVPVKVKGKPMVNFSTGFFATLNSSMQERTYEWQKTPLAGNTFETDTARYQLTSTGYAAPPIGISALMNGYFSSFPIGFSVGVGITAESKPKPVYMGGISALFGNKRQVIITIGGAMTQVKVVNEGLYSGLVYKSTSIPGDPSFSKTLKGGFFASITYTPFQSKSSSRTGTKSKRYDNPVPESKDEDKAKDKK